MPDSENPWLERRRDVRYSVELRVRVRVTGKEQFQSFEARDISRGGMFLAMQSPLAEGTRVSIELTHGGGYSMLLPGEVVRSIDPSQTGPDGAGVGIRIGPLSDAEQEILDVFIDETGAPAEAAAPAPPEAAVQAPSALEKIEACRQRLESEPVHAFFRLGENAAPTAMRLAYQAQLKQWHPSNFMQESRDVLEAATALCRSIRGAYERWTKSRADG